jgi:catechol 2,3-dioxygenase-like lactoylglutathione lyase family enzyme
MSDVGLTHIALPVKNIDVSIAFYAKYAAMQVVHSRTDAESGVRVVWLSDHTRPFVIVLAEIAPVGTPLLPFVRLGVGCATREEVDRLCTLARSEGRLHSGPTDSGYPIGYWAFFSDPDGHTLEISFGQEVALTLARTQQ